MRDDWRELTLGEVVGINPESTSGFRPKDEISYIDLSSVDLNSGISKDLYQGSYGEAPGRARRVVRSQDVLVATVRPYLKGFAVVPESLDGAVASTGFCVLRAKSREILPSYIWGLVSTNEFVNHLMDRATGSSYPAVRPEDIASFPVLLPQLSEQSRIVDLLASVDAYIESLQQQADAARTVHNAVLHDLLSAGSDDWTETTLGAIGSAGLFIDGDWVESKDQDPEGTFRLLQLADIGDGVFLNKSDRWMNAEQFSRLRCTPLSARDILIARMPDPIARACLVPDGLPTCATVVDVAILRCGKDYLPEFLVLVINDSSFRDAATSLLTGTTRQRISRSNLASLALRIPPLSEQQRIVEVASAINEAALASQVVLEEAQGLRSGLLANLLSGEHEIPESYDRFLGAA
jgi:restriction endonuclease S subunit